MWLVFRVGLLFVLSSCMVAQQSLQQETMNMQRSADSLHALFRYQWMQSDSIRISSILNRMRGDSLRRAIAGMHSSIDSDSVILTTLKRSSERQFKPGITVADSLTLQMLEMFPDTGIASYYADRFHGAKTSSGEIYNMEARTCAHRWLPFGATVRITNMENGKSVVLLVNDRGPWKHGRVIDVSKAAARELGFLQKGTAKVILQVESVITNDGNADEKRLHDAREPQDGD